MPGLIPNTPADIVQDLYLREIKAYKPTPAVSISVLEKMENFSNRHIRLKMRQPDP